MSETPPSRALITEAAAELLRRLQARHGALMFHQSGGCCDGSSPMCYLDGEFLVGDRDVLLSILDVGSVGVPVWISGPQFEAWKHPTGYRRRAGLFDFDRAISMKSGLRPAVFGCSGIVSGGPSSLGFGTRY
jgi:uncharacterized protein (DUF779 family)